MLKHLEEFRKYVEITGFNNVHIKELDKFFKTIRMETPSDVEVQFFNAMFIATWQHLYFAALNALTAFQNGRNISRSRAMETMLYASAQRQIRKAMELVGVKPHSPKIAVLLIAEHPETLSSALSAISKQFNAEPNNEVLKLSKEKTAIIQRAFEISNIELRTMAQGNRLEEALSNLVIERMALLATQH